MKRCWFGAALLIGLLVLGICSTVLMERYHSPTVQDLEQAANFAEKESWEQAEACIVSARNRWERHRKFSASLADHEPMDEIDQLFAELEIWLRAKESDHCASICAQLSRAAEAIKDAHSMTWWNLL